MPGYGTRYGVLDYGQEIENYETYPITVFHIAENTLRVNFQSNMILNSALLDASTYDVQAISIGAINCVVLSVINTSESSQPNFVDLIITELTGEPGNNSYNLTIVNGALQKAIGDYIYSPDNVILFDAIPFKPYVVRAEAITGNVVDLWFNENMEHNDDFRAPTSYKFTGGIVARAISIISDKKVRIYVTPSLATDQLYVVTVDPD